MIADKLADCCSVQAPDKRAHNKHAGHNTAAFLKKFWICLVLAIPVVLYADVVKNIFRWSPPEFPGAPYVPLLLGSIVFFYGGWVFLAGAWREVRAGLPGMMTLISIAVSTAYLWSMYATFAGGEPLFWELATLITIMLLGHWLEMRAVSGAEGALKELAKLLPDKAEVIRGDRTEVVPLAELAKGDLVLVKPGGRVPADGVVADGMSDVDESIATGESKLVPKKTGDEVIAGTTNGDGALKVTVTKIGEETFLAGVMRLVRDAQRSKSRLQTLSDKAAYYLTIVAVVAGGATLAVWLAFAEPAFAVSRMVAVLVIACPHALGLAVPLVASISTTKAARNGFLVRRRLALEAARDIDVVLFDKTGTLTTGTFSVTRVIAAPGVREADVLHYAASVNVSSEHPLAQAIVAEAQRRGVALSEAENFMRIPGKGVSANIGGEEVLVGSMSFAGERGAAFANVLRIEVDALAHEGKTMNVVVKSGKVLGVLACADAVRKESREAIRALTEMSIRSAMITGDADDVAKRIAGELGIGEYFARVLPEEKSEKVKLLQAKGQRVAMVGDGVNDAPALAQADVGIAIGAGTNVAIESSGIILVRNDPRDVVRIIRLSRLTYAKMVQNLFWAAGYNVAAIPLAAGVLASKGILLQPALAAVLMSLSTVIVAVNALLLARRRI